MKLYGFWDVVWKTDKTPNWANGLWGLIFLALLFTQIVLHGYSWIVPFLAFSAGVNLERFMDKL